MEKYRKMLEVVRTELVGFATVEEIGGVGLNNALHCMCGISSYIVFNIFKDLGEKPIFHENTNHCFITVRGYYVDLTLKQFHYDCPNVYVNKKPYPSDNNLLYFVHKSERKARTTQEIREIFKNWDHDQNPFNHRLPKIKLYF